MCSWSDSSSGWVSGQHRAGQAEVGGAGREQGGMWGCECDCKKREETEVRHAAGPDCCCTLLPLLPSLHLQACPTSTTPTPLSMMAPPAPAMGLGPGRDGSGTRGGRRTAGAASGGSPEWRGGRCWQQQQARPYAGLQRHQQFSCALALLFPPVKPYQYTHKTYTLHTSRMRSREPNSVLMLAAGGFGAPAHAPSNLMFILACPPPLCHCAAAILLMHTVFPSVGITILPNSY